MDKGLDLSGREQWMPASDKKGFRSWRTCHGEDDCYDVDMSEDCGHEHFSNTRLSVGVAWSKGGRDLMQDTYCLVLNHARDRTLDFLGLFDGHGANGESVALFVAQNLCDIVVHRAEAGEDFCAAIRHGCLELDSLLRQNQVLRRDADGRVVGGSTALAAWFRHGRIYCANVGDSRLVVSLACGDADAATDDHKPSRHEEKFRIVRAGGYVANDRVMETLAVARSFGDFAFKERATLGAEEQMVTARPDVSIVAADAAGVDFIVMATDGVWDRVTNQQAVNLVRAALEAGDAVDVACKKLIERCHQLAGDVAGDQPLDNMTVMVAILK